MNNLSEAHRLHLKASAISDEVIEARGYRTINDAAELHEAGFTHSKLNVPGLLLPLCNTAGLNGMNVYRPDVPRVLLGKPVKYEYPAGEKMHLDCPPSCRDKLRDISTPLYITEGQKKADALASEGATAIALLGVWNWRDGSGWLHDWDDITLKGRKVLIAFDSDTPHKPEVLLARSRLTSGLQRRDAKVYNLNLPDKPDGTKQGIDDWMAMGHSHAELKGLVVEAPTAAEPTPSSSYLEQLFTYEDALKPREPVPMIVEGYIRECSLYQWFGDSGVGKTNLLIDMLLHVAAGMPWLPSVPEEGASPTDGLQVIQCPVLWVDLEMGKDRVFERIEALGRSLGVSADLPQYGLSMPNPPLSNTNIDKLTAFVLHITELHGKPPLVVIDNMTMFSDVDSMSEAAQMKRVMQALKELIRVTGCTVIVIHHPNKLGEFSRDSTAIRNMLDGEYRQSEEPNSSVIVITHTKWRDRRMPPINVKFEFETEDGETLYSAAFYRSDAPMNKASSCRECILSALETGSKNDTQLRKMAGVRRQTFDTVSDELLAEEIIQYSQNGAGRGSVKVWGLAPQFGLGI